MIDVVEKCRKEELSLKGQKNISSAVLFSFTFSHRQNCRGAILEMRYGSLRSSPGAVEDV